MYEYATDILKIQEQTASPTYMKSFMLNLQEDYMYITEFDLHVLCNKFWKKYIIIIRIIYFENNTKIYNYMNVN